jgi:hypothetical protein
VPRSDVDRNQSHYSRRDSAYRSSDGTTESESSEEEGEAIKSLESDMLEQPIDNEQLLQKSNKAIKQKPGDTTKQPTIVKRPVNDEQVGENCVRVPKPVNRKPNEFLVLDYETGNLVPPQ